MDETKIHTFYSRSKMEQTMKMLVEGGGILIVCWMETYSYLNGLLARREGSYLEFEKELKGMAVEQQTYLNLFLVTTASHKATSPDFEKYIILLTHFKEITGKKSADINYIGYKDRKNILMHAAQKGAPHAVEILLNHQVEAEVTDPIGRTAAFYAIRNPNEEHSNGILTHLLNRHPKLLTMEAVNGTTLLNEAVDTLRTSTIELLLRKGANPNTKLKDTGNTVSHELLKYCLSNREAVLSILLLLAKYKANFEEPNLEGQTVFQKAMREGINFQDYATFCALLENDESVVEETDNEFDKISLTTLNQATKGGDTRSEIEQSDSHPFSGRVDFSQLDELNPSQPLEPSEAISLCDLQELNSSDDYTEPEEINYEELSKQIIDFSQEQQKIYLRMIPMVEEFLGVIDRIAGKFQLGIDVVGSFATGLWSSRSDVNVSLTPKTSDFINFQTALQKIYKIFKSRKQELQILDIHFTKSKVSCINITLGEKCNHQKFDIAIFHRNHLNKQYATYILESLSGFPQIKPLFFVLLTMCRNFGLDDPQAGGLKTYALFLMISSVVKSMPTKNVGELFFHVALYYGFYFQFGFDLESCEPHNYEHLQQFIQQALQYPRMKFNLIDPFNHKNNIGGKSTRARQLQNMCRAIYYWLSQPVQKPYLPQLFQLNYLF